LEAKRAYRRLRERDIAEFTYSCEVGILKTRENSGLRAYCEGRVCGHLDGSGEDDPSLEKGEDHDTLAIELRERRFMEEVPGDSFILIH
jgi:hypothetical protein